MCVSRVHRACFRLETCEVTSPAYSSGDAAQVGTLAWRIFAAELFGEALPGVSGSVTARRGGSTQWVCVRVMLWKEGIFPWNSSQGRRGRRHGCSPSSSPRRPSRTCSLTVSQSVSRYANHKVTDKKSLWPPVSLQHTTCWRAAPPPYTAEERRCRVSQRPHSFTQIKINSTNNNERRVETLSIKSDYDQCFFLTIVGFNGRLWGLCSTSSSFHRLFKSLPESLR